MSVYVAVVRKSDTQYGVEFPDFPGCITAADSLQDVMRQAREALEFHIRGTLEDGGVLPDPTTPASEPDTMMVLIEVSTRPLVIKRLNVTIESRLLDRIDSRAHDMGYTRSGYLAYLARKDLEL